MKYHLVGLVFFALVLSTFGHEINSRSRHGHHAKKARDNADGLGCTCPCPCTTTAEPTTTSEISITETGTSAENETTTSSADITDLTTETTTCSDVITDSTTETTLDNGTTTLLPTSVTPIVINLNGTLQIYINASARIVAVVNSTANIAYVLDLNARISVFFNGVTGAVFVLDLQTNVGYYLSARSRVSWIANQQSFASFFDSINVRAVFAFAASNGTRFTLANINVQISAQLTLVLQAVGVVTNSTQGAIALWAQISLRWTLSLQGSFSGLLTVIGSGVTQFRGSLLQVVGVFQGIGDLLVRLQIQVSVLIQARVRFELSRILNIQASVQIFIYIVTVLRQNNINVTVASNSTTIFELVAFVSGNSTQGASGAITVVAQLVALAQRRIQISVAIQTLISYYQSNTNVTITIEVIRQYLISLRDSARAAGLVQVAADIDLLLSRRYIVNGVEIWSLIVVLVQANVNPLTRIVQILVAFRSIVSVETSIGELFIALIIILRDANGSTIIGVLLNTQIQIEGNFVSVLQSAVSTISITEIVRIITLQGRGLFDLLIRIRIFGQIIGSINAGLSVSTQVTVQSIFANFSFAIRYSLTIVQVLFSVRGSVSITTGPILGKHLDGHHEHEHHVENEHHQHEDKHSLHHSRHHGNEEHRAYEKHHGHEKHHEAEKHYANAKHHETDKHSDAIREH